MDWTYLCPPAMLVPEERTGHYRIGQDVLLVNNNGESRISMEDFVVANVRFGSGADSLLSAKSGHSVFGQKQQITRDVIWVGNHFFILIVDESRIFIEAYCLVNQK